MKIEEQVLTIKQMNHLKELGVEVKDTAMVYLHFNGFPDEEERARVYFQDDLCGSDVYSPTLTLQEILELLPYDMTWDTWQWQIDHCGENMEYNDGDGYCSHRETKGSLLDKAYNMLCWCAENGYLNKE